MEHLVCFNRKTQFFDCEKCAAMGCEYCQYTGLVSNIYGKMCKYIHKKRHYCKFTDLREEYDLNGRGGSVIYHRAMLVDNCCVGGAWSIENPQDYRKYRLDNLCWYDITEFNPGEFIIDGTYFRGNKIVEGDDIIYNPHPEKLEFIKLFISKPIIFNLPDDIINTIMEFAPNKFGGNVVMTVKSFMLVSKKFKRYTKQIIRKNVDDVTVIYSCVELKMCYYKRFNYIRFGQYIHIECPDFNKHDFVVKITNQYIGKKEKLLHLTFKYDEKFVRLHGSDKIISRAMAMSMMRKLITINEPNDIERKIVDSMIDSYEPDVGEIHNCNTVSIGAIIGYTVTKILYKHPDYEYTTL